MAGTTRRWHRPQYIDFRIEFVDGTSLETAALGVAVDGDYLLFISRWPEAAGLPNGNRVPRDRVTTVTTTARLSTGGFNMGFPPAGPSAG